MSRHVGWLLTEIEHQVDGRLSPASQQALLDEVDGHLDAAIRARLELGMDQEEAEREAVAEFGAPQSYVDQLLAIHERFENRSILVSKESKVHWPTLISFFAGCIWSVIWSILSVNREGSAFMNGIGVLCFASFAFFSYKARRPQVIPIAITTVCAYVAAIVLCSLTCLNLYHFGGQGSIFVSEAGENRAVNQSIVNNLDPMLVTLRRGLELHDHKLSAAEVNSLSPSDRKLLYSVPVVFPHNSSPVSLTTGPSRREAIRFASTTNFALASSEWHGTGARALGSLSAARESLEKQLVAIEAAEASYPFGILGNTLVAQLGLIPVWFTVGTILNLFVLCLGWLLNMPVVKQWRRRLA